MRQPCCTRRRKVGLSLILKRTVISGSWYGFDVMNLLSRLFFEGFCDTLGVIVIVVWCVFIKRYLITQYFSFFCVHHLCLSVIGWNSLFITSWIIRDFVESDQVFLFIPPWKRKKSSPFLNIPFNTLKLGTHVPRNNTHINTKSQNSGFNNYAEMPLVRLRKKHTNFDVRLLRSCFTSRLSSVLQDSRQRDRSHSLTCLSTFG